MVIMFKFWPKLQFSNGLSFTDIYGNGVKMVAQYKQYVDGGLFADMNRIFGMMSGLLKGLDSKVQEVLQEKHE